MQDKKEDESKQNAARKNTWVKQREEYAERDKSTKQEDTSKFY